MRHIHAPCLQQLRRFLVLLQLRLQLFQILLLLQLSKLRGDAAHRVKSVLPQWLPPPRDRMLSTVYVLRLPAPDGRWYVGETDDVGGRIQEHRRSPLKRNATFHYVTVANKSEATRAEAKLIATLLKRGVPLLSSKDASRTRTSAEIGTS